MFGSITTDTITIDAQNEQNRALMQVRSVLDRCQLELWDRICERLNRW